MEINYETQRDHMFKVLLGDRKKTTLCYGLEKLEKLYCYTIRYYQTDMPKFSCYSIVLKFNILFCEMKPLKYKKLKEIDHHSFHTHHSKPIILDHCQMSVNCNSHYQKLHQENVSFGIITIFYLPLKSIYKLLKNSEIYLKSEVQYNVMKFNAIIVLVDDIFEQKFATRKGL